ncbi:uncharacterized protein PG998_014158 [Apiospora kogelbergensis]|uniref:uncharacterized protein n=1 Tax=Apiospora kogelbergensis TaxID=1337665 RepID=UPI00312E3252
MDGWMDGWMNDQTDPSQVSGHSSLKAPRAGAKVKVSLLGQEAVAKANLSDQEVVVGVTRCWMQYAPTLPPPPSEVPIVV